MRALLRRWSDRRMYRQLRDSYLIDAMFCRLNQSINPERANFWREEADRYLDRAWGYHERSRRAG